MRKFLPYGRQWIDDADIDAIVEVLRSDWLTTGPRVEEFEAKFARTVGAKHAIAVSSGTAALHTAVYAAGIGPGDEVIVPPLTFVATANCVRYQAATVVFADVHPDTLLIDPAQVVAAASERTRAVIAVDYAGQPADLDDLLTMARDHGWILIEDAAHSLGARYKDRFVGSIADLTTFSLHPVKHITTGEGGVVTTNDDRLASRAKLFRNHGISTDHRQREQQGAWEYEMLDLGFNYRITDFQCALGHSQLDRLEEWVARRREISARYDDAFRTLPIEPLIMRSDRQSSRHLYVIRLRLQKCRAERATIFRALREQGLGVNVHYIPVHYHPYYQRLGFRRGQYPESERAYERLITLPLYPKLSDQEVRQVIDAVVNVLTELCS